MVVAAALADARRRRRLRGAKKRCSASSSASASSPRPRWPSSGKGTGCSPRASSDRQHRHRRQLRLLRLAAAARSPATRTRWIASPPPATPSATSAAAWRSALNLAWIAQPAAVRARRRRRRATRGSPSSAVALWWAAVLASRSSGACPSRRRGARGRRARAARRRGAGSSASTFRDLRSYRQAFLLLVAVPDLQRRHRHDHPDGGHLRRGARHRPQHDHRRDPAGAVRRASRSPSSSARWPAGSARSGRSSSASPSTSAISVARRTVMRTTRRLLSCSALLVGTVQGGHARRWSRSLFASMVPRAQVGGVLRLLRGLREVRRHPRPAGLRGRVAATGSSRAGDPVGDRPFFVVGGALLLARRRRGGPARGAGGVPRGAGGPGVSSAAATCNLSRRRAVPRSACSTWPA